MPGGLPVVGARRASAIIKVDGVIDPEEWTPGEKQTVSVNVYKPEELIWQATGEKAKNPSKAYLEVDGENLYIAFANDVDPEGGIVGGHQWGQSDAVELALSIVTGLDVGPIMIWRGYTDGHWETSDEAEAPKALLAQARTGVEYACKTVSKNHWSAEFKIPFEAIGIEPQKHNPRILFSLAVRKVSGNQWVTWKKSPGGSWDVRKSGILWLEPFGDIVLNGAVPSWARCEIQKQSKDMLIDAGKNSEILTWAKPAGIRLKAKSAELDEKWRQFTFKFTPKVDGQVRLELRGRPLRSTINHADFIPIWTYWDNLRVEGATLANGDFEDVDPKSGKLTGWQQSSQALRVTAPGIAASGKACVKTWFLGSINQVIDVKQGVTVTVQCQIRGEPIITQ